MTKTTVLTSAAVMLAVLPQAIGQVTNSVPYGPPASPGTSVSSSFTEPMIAVGGESARVAIISLLGRRFYWLELPVHQVLRPASQDRCYVNYYYPNGYHHADVYLAKDLFKDDYLRLTMPEHRVRRGGLGIGDSVSVAVSVGAPAPDRTSRKLASNVFSFDWDVRGVDSSQVVVRDLGPTPCIAALQADDSWRRAVHFASIVLQEDSADAESDLASQIKDLLAQTGGLEGADISVTTLGQEVTLRGTVVSEGQRTTVLDAVRTVPDVEVNDQLEISQPPPPIEEEEEEEEEEDLREHPEKTPVQKSCGGDVTVVDECGLATSFTKKHCRRLFRRFRCRCARYATYVCW